MLRQSDVTPPVLQAAIRTHIHDHMNIPYHTPLSPDLQAQAGITPGQPLAMADQVRFSELDSLNHVNNAAYMAWFERLRIRYVQDWGLADFHSASAPRIVIRSGNIHYLREMLMDEDYVVTCGCSGFRNTSFTVNQQLWSGGTLRATFDCVLVLLEPDASARRAISDAVRDKFTMIDKALPQS